MKNGAGCKAAHRRASNRETGNLLHRKENNTNYLVELNFVQIAARDQPPHAPK
jgi:hypothetical protein